MNDLQEELNTIQEKETPKLQAETNVLLDELNTTEQRLINIKKEK